MKKLLRYGFIGIVFPLLVQFVFYFQFTSNYTQDLFSEQGFIKFYDTGVYKSRQLGKQLHLWTYHQLSGWDKMKKLKENPYNSRRLLHLDKNADPVFYLSYFFIAAFFTVLTSLMLLFLLDQKEFFRPDEKLRDLTTCFLVLLIGFTQFVVTPYDTIGYFFQALGMFLFLRYLKGRNLLFFIGLLVIITIATLNRETSLIILSFMAAIYYSIHRLKWTWIRDMLLPALCFAIPYLYLKLNSTGGAFTDQSQLFTNLNLLNTYAMTGFLFALLAFWLVFHLNRNKPLIISSFLLFSLPYIIIIFIAGITQEYRLWMPLIEGGLILGLLNVKNFGEGEAAQQ